MNPQSSNSIPTLSNTLRQDAPTILIVDDEKLVRWSLKNMLQKNGFDVTIVESGEKAIEKLYAGRFDLVITDMKLPRADGFEVASTVKILSPEIPIIMISAYGDSRSREKAKECKIDYFVDKPFDVYEFMNFVKSIVLGDVRNVE